MMESSRYLDRLKRINFRDRSMDMRADQFASFKAFLHHAAVVAHLNGGEQGWPFGPLHPYACGEDPALALAEIVSSSGIPLREVQHVVNGYVFARCLDEGVVFQAENPYWHLVDFWEKGGVLHIENRMLVCTAGMITIGKMQDHLRAL